jgi:hypothetical protein
VVAYNALIVEGFDAAFSVLSLQGKYPGSTVGTASGVAGRIRDNGVQFIGSGNNGLGMFLDPAGAGATYNKIVAGFGFKPSAQSLSIAALRTNLGNRDFELFFNTGSNVISTRRNGTVIATGTTALTPGTWYYIEFKVQMSTTSGSIEVRINGVTEAALTLSGAQSAAANTCNLFQLSTANATFQYDDLVVQDWSVAGVDFLGDVSVAILYPNGAGNYQQFTPLSGTRLSNIDETQNHDTDTTYNSDATVSDRDSFTHAAFPSNGTPFIVQAVSVLRKDDAGAKTARTFIRDASASTDYDGTIQTMSTTYIEARDIYNSDPAGGAWTQANVEDDEIGYKVQA